ncbi:hypothetical protein [Desulfatiglans anilini]|uniref:hypothetical protein n=1 Tax=Desulfatiglans anilini TaxID=90728 RepID=UPI0004198991|nr:hypothetical protein [Desulfatiglans anilini]
MTNRTAFFVLGAALIIVALGGFLYFHHSQAQKAEIARLEAIAEQERQKARAAEEARREQEERKLAAIQEEMLLEKKELAEQERQRRLEEEQRREAERLRKAKEEARQWHLAEQRRLEAERVRRQQEKEAANQKAIEEQKARLTKFSFKMDPAHSKEIAVAQVYTGDYVTIQVKRNGEADEKLFVGALPVRTYQYLLDPTNSGTTSRFWAKGPDGSPTLVTMPIKDSDSFEISNKINVLHPYAEGLRLGGSEGNILVIGTGLSDEGFVTSIFGARKGSLEILVTIDSKNKWGIKTRSLL